MKKPIIFIQDYGTYAHDILVAAGATRKEIIAFSKKNKCKKDFIEWLEKDERMFELSKTEKGLFCWSDAGKLLLLRTVKDDWEYWECVMHEVHHATHHLAKRNMMEDEMEGQAYLFEFLFRSIRKKLQTGR